MSSSAGSDDEQPAPKYSLFERERRWLVDPALLPPLDGPGRRIEDRYINGTRLRLRSVDGAWKLGKKYDAADLSSRPIVNVYLSEAEARVLATLPAVVLVKRRFAVEEFVVDRFEGALDGLWLAEIERPSADALAAVRPPRCCVAEVTDDARYTGGLLAREGRV